MLKQEQLKIKAIIWWQINPGWGEFFEITRINKKSFTMKPLAGGKNRNIEFNDDAGRKNMRLARKNELIKFFKTQNEKIMAEIERIKAALKTALIQKAKIEIQIEKTMGKFPNKKMGGNHDQFK